MSLKEKKVVQTITVCDFCDSDIASPDVTTHVEASTSGFMKRDNFQFDLCESCASTLGLKRRGRKPADENKSSTSSDSGAPRRKRGRPSKAEIAAREAQANSASVNDDGWEYEEAETASA